MGQAQSDLSVHMLFMHAEDKQGYLPRIGEDEKINFFIGLCHL